MHRTALTVATLVSSTTLAIAQPAPPGGPADQPSGGEAGPEKEAPGRGDFDAGGRVRLPSGPDDMGEFATFNWIAADLTGRYYLLDTVTVTGEIPLAVKKPDMLGEVDPRAIGGMTVTLDARLPRWDVPLAPRARD